LMRRFDDINLQRLGMACALAGMEPTEYAKFQEVAAQEEVEVRKIIGEQHSAVYAALDDPNGDWCKAVLAVLDTRPIVRSNSR